MINQVKKMTKKETNAQLSAIHGGLSEPSKMPCFSYSIPASKCITGGKLHRVENSVCSNCYAEGGFYLMPNTREALNRRFQSLSNPLWVSAMVQSIRLNEKSGFFRWHDSGDIQSVTHLRMICEVCEQIPEVNFWLPTREYSLVESYLQQFGSFPSNLTVRLSAYLVGNDGPVSIAKRLGLTVSGVKEAGFNCPASKQGNKCGNCRLCWNKSHFSVNYHLH